MTLLDSNVNAWKPRPVSVFAVDNGIENSPSVIGKKKDWPNYCSKQYSTELYKPISSPAAVTKLKRQNQKQNSKTRHRHSKTKRIDNVHLGIGSDRKEINYDASLYVMHPQNTNDTIPTEISFHSSTTSVDSDLESEARPRIRRTPFKNVREKLTQREFHNMCICLELLESERFDDNCIGMERLVSMTNHELVNSSRFLTAECRDTNDRDNSNMERSLLTSSISYSLVCNSNAEEEFSERLRAVYPSFLCEEQSDGRTASFAPPCIASSSYYSKPSLTNKQHGESLEFSQTKSLLKLPALRLLVSSLELVSRTTTLSPRNSNEPTSKSMDLQNGFWRLILKYMTKCLQDFVASPVKKNAQEEEDSLDTTSRGVSCKPHCNYDHNNRKITINTPGSSSPCSIEAALVVKGIRLLHKIQPEMMNPYVRYTLLPFVSNAREFGFEQHHLHLRARKHHRKPASGAMMLVRECDRLLRSFV